MPMKLAGRLDLIEPFYVMEFAKAASALAASPACDSARGGEPMIFLNIGEPDFSAAPLVQQAALACLREGRTQYTQATGLPALRQRIAAWYGSQHGVDIAPARIVVTAGASAALQLLTAALFEASLENRARCESLRVSLELHDFCLKENGFQELVQASLLERGNGNERRLTAPIFGE